VVKHVLVERPNCKENFNIIDGRLVICALAVGTALVALGWDYKYTFPTSK
jgi:signal peptidase complex subunit 2